METDKRKLPFPLRPLPLPAAGDSTAATPEETIQAFREAYSLEDVQAALWHCLQPRLLEHLRGANPDLSRTALYEHLEILLSAVYQLPLPAPAPIAAALQALSQQAPGDWVLLISPPE